MKEADSLVGKKDSHCSGNGPVALLYLAPVKSLDVWELWKGGQGILYLASWPSLLMPLLRLDGLAVKTLEQGTNC